MKPRPLLPLWVVILGLLLSYCSTAKTTDEHPGKEGDLESVVFKGSNEGGNAVNVELRFVAESGTHFAWHEQYIGLRGALLLSGKDCVNLNVFNLDSSVEPLQIPLGKTPDLKLLLSVPGDEPLCSFTLLLQDGPAFYAEGETSDGRLVRFDIPLGETLRFDFNLASFSASSHVFTSWIAVLDDSLLTSDVLLNSLEPDSSGTLIVDAKHNALKVDELRTAIIRNFALYLDANGNGLWDELETGEENLLAQTENEEGGVCENPTVCGVGLKACCPGFVCSNDVYGVVGECLVLDVDGDGEATNPEVCENPTVCGIGIKACCPGYVCSNDVYGVMGECLVSDVDGDGEATNPEVCENPTVCGIGIKACCPGYVCSNDVYGVVGECLVSTEDANTNP